MTAPRTPRTTATQKPVVEIALDLDALTNEPDEPFFVQLGGRRIQLNSVADLDWKVVAKLDPGKPHAFFRTVVAEDDQEHFFKTPLTAKNMKSLMDLYWDFYGLAPGESDA